MSSKILNKYSLILFNLDRNTYNAYRKMMETSQRKYKNNNNNNNSLSSKSSYSNLLNLKKKSYIPFSYSERRFEWQNMKNPSNLLEFEKGKSKLKRILIRNELDGGFKKFYEKNNRKNLNKSMENKYPIQKKNSLISTKRVIQPSLDYDEKDYSFKTQKRINLSFSQKHLYSSGGNMITLFDKTPSKFVNKGKKKFINLFSQKNSVNIFCDEYGKYQKPINYMKYKYRNYKDNVNISNSIEVKYEKYLNNNIEKKDNNKDYNKFKKYIGLKKSIKKS